MLGFAQVVKVGGFETLTFSDLIRRPEAPTEMAPIMAALGAGDLVAYVQLEDGATFYRVPAEHWQRSDGIMEGEPCDSLFCWSGSRVPAKFHDKPIVFFADEVAQWERCKGQAAIDALIAPDVDAFAETIADATIPREGYWEPFTVFLWIATRDESVTAAMQQHEKESAAHRGGLHSSALAMVADSFLFTRYEKPLIAALNALVEAMQSNRIAGVIGDNIATGNTEEVPRRAWADTEMVHEYGGMQLAFGYTNCRFPSEEVRAAFLPLTEQGPEGKTINIQCAPKAGLGRRKNVGGYASHDAPLVEEMHSLIERQAATSPWDAARLVSDRARGSDASKQKRLTQRYKDTYKEAQ